METREPSTLLDDERLLALSYVSQRYRPAVRALWELDATFAGVLRARGDAMVTRIKLAWWREALERLDRERAPAQPVLVAVQEQVISRGVSGARLAAMEEGWSLLLEPGALGADAIEAYAAARGAGLFAATTHLLGAEPPTDAGAAGMGWALIDLARHAGERVEALAVLRAAARHLDLVSLRWPARLRPLGMLAVLARRDASAWPAKAWERPGAPARMLRMLRYRLTGG